LEKKFDNRELALEEVEAAKGQLIRIMELIPNWEETGKSRTHRDL
jgi:hypothetical protein